MSQTEQPRYYVLAAPLEDISAGWCWIKNCPNVSNRSMVKITNKRNGKSIRCEALNVDENFIKRYMTSNSSKRNRKILNEKPAIVINAWYRNRLDITETQLEYDFDIEVLTKWDIADLIRACLTNPQSVVRISSWLAIISIAIGVVSLISSQPHKIMLSAAIGYAIGKIKIS